MQDTYRIAPPGFKRGTWEQFQTDGILVVENALSANEIALYLGAVDRMREGAGGCLGSFYLAANFIEKAPEFASLIDHTSHVGLVYDLFGEMLKLQLSEAFVRPHGIERRENWHIDGPRLTPYAAFAPEVPLQVRVGYWLTDVPQQDMGNLVYLPGSHRHQYFDAYGTHETVAGEVQLCVPKGAMTIMNCALWHRTAPNITAMERKTLYLGYCPSWIPTGDRTQSNPAWLQTLNREQRIIMRSYDRAYDHAKPPASDVPLFLDRKTGLDRETGIYREHVHLLHRKRTLWWEGRRTQ